MTSRGKAKSVLAPTKALIQRLELTREEGVRLTTLTSDFLRKTKGLRVKDIIKLDDKELYDLARELLYTETTPGKGPTGPQYWPVDDDFPRSSAFVSDPTRFITPVRDIMRNQRNDMANTRQKHPRQTLPSIENPESEVEARPSGTPGADLYTGFGPTIEDREASTEVALESRELPSFEEILNTPREVPAAPNPSNSGNSSSHLATPPITPAAPGDMQHRQAFYSDSPRPSVEVSPRASTSLIQNFPAQGPFRSPIDLHSRRRERSPTAFAEYNPRLPTHRDGTLDESSVKAWKDGVAFVRDRVENFSRGLRKQHRAYPKTTMAEQDSALEIYHKYVGLDDFLEFLDNDLQKQHRRLKEFKALTAVLGAGEERGASRTLSP